MTIKIFTVNILKNESPKGIYYIAYIVATKSIYVSLSHT